MRGAIGSLVNVGDADMRWSECSDHVAQPPSAVVWESQPGAAVPHISGCSGYLRPCLRWASKVPKTVRNPSKVLSITMLDQLHIQVFADGADRDAMLELAAQPHIAGLTTNPTLMRKAGITDYRAFAQSVLSEIKKKPISFEVFSDDFREMERQAHEIASWGANVYVKIPVTNTRAESSAKLIRRLARAGVKQNVTALMTLEQVAEVSTALGGDVPSYISVFAGRIADTGRDPMPIMTAAVQTMRPTPNQRLIWASPREVLNIFQADQIGCHIITVTNDLLKKLGSVGKDLAQFSLETVQMFHDDAQAAGFTLPILPRRTVVLAA
jgi:transaldolase